MQTVVNVPVALTVSFGSSYGSLVDVGYTLKNPDGSTSPAPAAARTQVGVVNDGNGFYHVTVTFTTAWNGIVVWDGLSGALIAEEDIEVIPAVREDVLSDVAIVNTNVSDYPGTTLDPQEIVHLRESSLDFHRTMGQLVIHKHRWNLRDVQEGRAQLCPFHDPAYGEASAYDQYCFGTGFLGGFDNGVLVPVTIGDSQEDVFRPNQYGVVIHERHPGLAAPWTPEMGDDDIVIVVETNPKGVVTEVGDRYILREVTPTTIRGPGYHTTFNMKPYKVSQEAMIDLLPPNHQFYNVPINFDYTNIPTPAPPDYPTGTLYSEFSIPIRIVGAEKLPSSSREQDVRVAVAGNTSGSTVAVRIVGAPSGTHFHDL